MHGDQQTDKRSEARTDELTDTLEDGENGQKDTWVEGQLRTHRQAFGWTDRRRER